MAANGKPYSAYDISDHGSTPYRHSGPLRRANVDKHAKGSPTLELERSPAMGLLAPIVFTSRCCEANGR